MNGFAIVILAVLAAEYALSALSSALNLRALNPALPREFNGVFDADRYARSQEYTRTGTRFDMLRSTANLAIVLVWWQAGGFAWLDTLLRGWGHGPVVTGLLYIGALALGSMVLGLPFRLYSTFVIEQRFGFNRTTAATFAADLLKGMGLTVVLGGAVLGAVLLFFELTGALAWFWCWLAVTAFMLAVQFVAPQWIMPLFNKFTPLEGGDLREAILGYARSADFPVKDIFVVDGSRRSSKANAFFAGFGRNKRIGLYDTLVKDYSVPELVAVVAHEVGHYKKRHILQGMVLQIGYTGMLFFVLSLVLQERGLFDAFYMREMSTYAGLVFFGLLFTPVDMLLSLLVNAVSRRNEFQADAFAAGTTGSSGALIAALKKLSADSLSNLTPHPLHVFLHYSHPPVLRRIDALRRTAPQAGALAAAAALAVTLAACGAAGPPSALSAGAAGAVRMPDKASVSGTVAAEAPFTAARVYIRNVERRMLYMVYTEAGRFRAVALFPGRYEVSARAPGLASDVQRLVLDAGGSTSLELSLRAVSGAATPAAPGGGGELPAARAAATYLPYDELYPPGPGRDVAERTCMPCHGGNFLSSRPSRPAAWEAGIDKMLGRALANRPAISYGDGIISYRDAQRGFSLADRETLLAYLVEHFGPDAPPRRIRIEQQMPVDEAALGKALYIEYYLPEDASGQGVNAPEFAGLSGNFTGRRVGQDVRFDRHGNVWLTDRGYPHRLVKLDPRSGAFTDYVLPDPKNGIHEVNIDRDGIVWVPEHRGVQSREVKRLLGLDPQTGRWEHRIPMDPDNVVRNAHKWMQSLAIDSRGNIYVGWIMGGALSKWERATGKVSVFPIPMPGAVPYGVVPDRDDNIWIGLWNAGKLAKFDTTTHQWTEFTPPTYPGHVRRPNVDSQNNVWFGIYAAGPRPGKLVKLDQSTGRMTEHTIPQQGAAPYDVAMDAEDNIWAADVGQGNDGDHGASIWRFDPRTETFTFYPKPQPGADSPKIQVTREGAVWYSPRGSRDAPAIGVLYPDMDRIATLGAYYLHGPPGNVFATGQQ